MLLTKHGYSPTVSSPLQDGIIHCCLHHPHLRRHRKTMIVYVSAGQVPDENSMIELPGILLRFLHEPHCDPFLHRSHDHCSDTQADSENACINLEQSPVRTDLYGTAHFDNCLAGKPSSNEYFNIFNDEIDVWSPFSCNEESQLAHWCVWQNLSRAVINKRFRNPTMATVSNFTSSHTVFTRWNEISDPMGIDTWKSGKVCYNRLVYPNILDDDDFICLFHHNCV